MVDDRSDQAKILALFDRLAETATVSTDQSDTKIADQLAVLLAIRLFNDEGQDATCEALTTHLELSIERTIAATNALARNGYVEAFTTTVESASGSRSAIAFRIPGDERALHFLERGA